MKMKPDETTGLMVAALVLPSLGFVIASLIGQPSSATAMPQPALESSVWADLDWITRQDAPSSALTDPDPDESPARPTIESPFFVIEGPDTGLLLDPNPPTTTVDSGVEPPSLAVSSIVSRGDRSFAVIDGRLRRLGSRVAPGWTLEEIGSNRRRVVLVHSSGVRHTIRLDHP